MAAQVIVWVDGKMDDGAIVVIWCCFRGEKGLDIEFSCVRLTDSLISMNDRLIDWVEIVDDMQLFLEF